MTYKEGISDVTFHWWGMTIYLSKTLANKALAAGITLGGIWIPSKVIASVGAMLGLSDKEFYKGGIWIDQFWIANWSGKRIIRFRRIWLSIRKAKTLC